MSSIKTLAVAITGLSVFSAAYGQSHQNNNYSKSQIGMALMRANTVSLDHGKIKHGHNSIWAHLRSDFRMAEVNPELVRRHESKFASSAAYFNRTIERSRPYMYHISREVAKRNMPAEIALLPFIESAFVTKAKSNVGASGLWQFMPATGRHYGLEQTPLYDGRHDVYAATDAALNYLEYLHGLFGDWSLALAAYNWGEGNVGRAVNRARAQGLEPVYENLKMPAETRNYVPKLLAVRNIVSNPEYFGMRFSDIDNKPFFKAVDIDQPIDLNAAVRLAGISRSEFDALNPAFKSPVYIPKLGRKLLLPASAAADFERNYKKADRATLLSWDVYTPYANTTLSSIAAETGMNIAELKRLNGLSRDSIAAGRSILVAKNSFGGKGGDALTNFIALDKDLNPNDNKLQSVPEMGVATAVASAQPGLTAPPRPVNTPLQLPQAAVAAQQPAARTDAVQTASNQTTLPLDRPEPSVPAAFAALPDDLTVKSAIETAVPAPAQAAAQTQMSAQPAAAANDGSDRLMDFVRQSAPAAQTAAAPATAATQAEILALAEATAREAAERSRQAKQVAERARQKKPAALAAAKPATHKVAHGDTLFNIAKRYDMNVADLVAGNGIKGNTIHEGQILKVAAVGAAKSRAGQSSIRQVSYTVRQGDTLAGIARRFNVDVKDVRRWNKNSTVLKPGQSIRLQGS
ncbi:Membrane-bound lytic murein transglycosylase D precursor [Kingella potus]|uniref:Membrane-bound lytic murein transglycosylase D n=1 Tax=Kingella potus TaxID=265175 RepID=A0A377R395_9NEIS|nr:LysM peptidoglycan-binding domain-containing protein [Kingella potus]STR03398.1 Membrane-bound lytic murein transglycosylase D precursor [Kingella potus]